MNVLVIAEDPRLDQFLLKPIVQAMMDELKQPRARVQMCTEPLFRGVDEILAWPNISAILDRYNRFYDLYVLCVDRDGQVGRRERLNRIEELAAGSMNADQAFFAENAWQEVEVWALAGHDLPTGWRWQDIRQEVNSKEVYFAPFVTQRGVSQKPDEARKVLGAEAARRYGRIRQLCPEDVRNLETRIRRWLEGEG